MYDEEQRNKQRQSYKIRFFAGPKEQFAEDGQKAIRGRIETLFKEVKKAYSNIFRGNEEITLSNRALAFIVSELAKYDFTRTDVDAKGVAYQELVGVNLRGDRGQYFTPRGVVKLVIEMLDPKEHEVLLDPACGTGGFLVATLANILNKFRDEQNTSAGNESTMDFLTVHERLREYAASKVFGADFDPFLIRAAQMNMGLAGDGRGHLYNINSLDNKESDTCSPLIVICFFEADIIVIEKASSTIFSIEYLVTIEPICFPTILGEKPSR
jgi:type I restriction enzyme M protein